MNNDADNSREDKESNDINDIDDSLKKKLTIKYCPKKD